METAHSDQRQILSAWRNFAFLTIQNAPSEDITKTRLFKYIESFTTKKWKFSDEKMLVVFIFLLKTDYGYLLQPPKRVPIIYVFEQN